MPLTDENEPGGRRYGLFSRESAPPKVDNGGLTVN